MEVVALYLDGVKRMSEKHGGTEYAIHVKGLELPSYYGQGLEYATTNRGGCHVQGSTMFFEATGPADGATLGREANQKAGVSNPPVSGQVLPTIQSKYVLSSDRS